MPRPSSIDEPSDDLADYVRCAAGLLALPIDAERIERVASHLVRTRALAALLHGVALGVDDEPAELFCPAPFPAVDPSSDLSADPSADPPVEGQS